MTLKQTFTSEMTELVSRHNAYDKLTRFLCSTDNKDSLALLKEKSNYNQFSMRMYPEELRLQQIIVERYHGQKVLVSNGSKNLIQGTIKEELTRVFEGRTHNETATFRYISHEPMNGETLAFWVVTDDRYSTHLYNAEEIEMVGTSYWSQKMDDEKAEAEAQQINEEQTRTEEAFSAVTDMNREEQ